MLCSCTFRAFLCSSMMFLCFASSSRYFCHTQQCCRRANYVLCFNTACPRKQADAIAAPLSTSFPYAASNVVPQMDLAERVVSLARGQYDDATALVVVFE